MTSEIIRTIIDDLKKTKDMLDVEKADFLKGLTFLYEKECKPFKGEIEKLLDKWD